MDSFMKWLDVAREGAIKGFRCIVVAVFMIMGAAILFQIVLRMLGHSMIAMEDIAIFGFFWLVFVGATLAFYDGIHVKVEFFLNFMPDRYKPFLIFLSNFFVSIFLVFFTWSGILFTINNIQQHAMQLRISMAWVYFILPVSGLISFITLLGRFRSRDGVSTERSEAKPS